MVNDERPASFQVPGSGTLKDHIRYHEMLRKEFTHTIQRALEMPPPTVQRQVRLRACKLIQHRLNMHVRTTKRQLSRSDMEAFAAYFRTNP